MGLKGSRDQPADLESEREALRRQRLEAANELAALKQTLSERVAEVQQRERELTDAVARVEKREQKLDAAEDRSSRLDSVRLRLAEAKEARTRAGASVVSTQTPVDPAASAALDARESELARNRERRLPSGKPSSSSGPPTLTEREQAVEARERESVVSTQAPEPAPVSDELERVEAKLAELREAEKAFVRTQHELAARSDALTEQEAALAERERKLAAKEAPPPSPDLEILEARIRRLEQSGRPPARGGADVQRRPPRAPGPRSPRQPRARTSLYTDSRSRGVSSAGRAPPLQGGGRRFDPGTLHCLRRFGICGSRSRTREDP